MKPRHRIGFLGVLALLTLVSPMVLGQVPGDPRPDRPDGGGRQDGPGRGDRPDRPPRFDDAPRPPGAPGAQIDMMRGYLDVVDRYTRLARDPVAAGIGAVITANDILRPRGADAAIDYFNKILPEVKNEAVQRAIRT